LAEVVVERRRAGRPESLVYGDGVVVDGSGRLVAWFGNPHRETYWGAAARPFQALPLLTAGGLDQYDLDAGDLAFVLAGGPGGPAAEERVRAMLGRAGVDLAAWDGPWRQDMGGWLANLLLARILGVETPGSEDEAHPTQQTVLSVIQRYTGLERALVPQGRDDQGLPTCYLALSRMAWAYARLVVGRGMPDLDARAGLVVAEALRLEADAVWGAAAPEARLIRAAGQRVAAKGDEAGLLCAALPEKGWGMALKVDGGGAEEAAGAAAAMLSLLPAFPEEIRRDLAAMAVSPRVDARGREVGENMPVMQLQWGQVT